jgi:hypothetical protein
MGLNFQRERGLTPVQQIPKMKKLHPQFRHRIVCGAVTWTGYLTPTDSSQTYEVRVDHKPGCAPCVWVIKPKLRERSESEPIPHLYPEGDLCLYHPSKREWRPVDFIAETIVPWASLWLYYYEVWLAIGEWLGGGEHPEKRAPFRRER